MSILPVANTVQNPAVQVSNVYQDNSNLVKSGARVLSHDCFRSAFLSTQLGGSSITLTIPRNMLVSNVFVHLQMDLAGADGLQPRYYLPKGWGFNAIRRIVMVYGGSEQLEISGAANFERAMTEAETDRKKTALLELAGDFKIRSNDATPLEGGPYDAVVPIYLPHSSVNALNQIPFDCSLLTQNVTIRLDLVDAATLFKFQDVADSTPIVGGTRISTKMNNLSKGEWYVKQMNMIDSSASKADRVGPNGSAMYNYFFYYPQSFVSQTFDIRGGAAYTPIGNTQNVTLNGFRNGSLQSLVLWVEREDSNYALGTTAGSSPLPSTRAFSELDEIRLDYGGQCIFYASNDKAAQLLDLITYHTDGSFSSQQYKSNATSTSAATTVETRSPYYRIQISQFSEVFRSYLQTGANISSDTAQLSFRLSNKSALSEEITYKYKCHVQYVFQGAVSVQKGGASFMFSNPLPSPQPISLPMA